MYDSPDTVFFVDPPYANSSYYFDNNFSIKDHEDLAQMLKSGEYASIEEARNSVFNSFEIEEFHP